MSINNSKGLKVAISSIGKNIESEVSEIFGRCTYFIIAEIKDNKVGKVEMIENKNTEEMSGAGVSTSKLMAENDASVVITGTVGPRALDVLKQFGIEIYTGKGVIKDVLQEFIDGKLKKIN